MRTANGLFVLLASAVLCGMVQISAGQSSAKDEVLAALAEQDRAFLAGDETKVGQIKSEDYLQTDVEGNVLDKRTWFKEYFAPLAPRLRSGETRFTRFDRSDESCRSSSQASIRGIQKSLFSPARLASLDSLQFGSSAEEPGKKPYSTTRLLRNLATPLLRILNNKALALG